MQRLLRRSILRHADSAAGDFQTDLPAAQLFCRLPQRFKHAARLIAAAVGNQNGEFIAFKPVQRRRHRADLTQLYSEIRKNFIASAISIIVDDFAETIEADDHRHAFDICKVQFGKLPHRRQTGQRIDFIARVQARHHSGEQPRFTLFVFHHRAAAFQPHIIAALAECPVFTAVVRLDAGKNVCDVLQVSAAIFRMDFCLPQSSGIFHIFARQAEKGHGIFRPVRQIPFDVADIDINLFRSFGKSGEQSVVQNRRHPFSPFVSFSILGNSCQISN